MTKGQIQWLEFQDRVVSNPDYRAKLVKRIQEKSIQDPRTGCWNLTVAIGKNGYGMYGYARGRNPIGYHRVSYLVNKSDTVPAGMFVCHKCDNRKCVNPDHLFTGTCGDNSRDAASKNRLVLPAPRRGSLNRASKLSEEDVETINKTFIPRTKTGPGAASELARRFGVSTITIRRIANGKAWKHTGGCKNAYKNFLTPEQESEICRRHEPRTHSGPNTRSALAREFHVPAFKIDRVIQEHKNTLCSVVASA